MKQYEHFQVLIATTRRKQYYCSTKGDVYTIDRFSGKKFKLHPNIKDGKPRISIHGTKDPYLKHCVWYVATGHWPTLDENVVPIDGNELNCNITNLKIVDKREVAKVTGPMSQSQVVVVQEYKKEPIEYRSVRQAAKALYVSYQTLLDYLKGKYKNSVLKKYGRRIYLKERR